MKEDGRREKEWSLEDLRKEERKGRAEVETAKPKRKRREKEDEEPKASESRVACAQVAIFFKV